VVGEAYMIRFLASFITGLFFIFGAISAQAQDYAKGLAAAQLGDFVTALKEWQPLAEQGDAEAQNGLGYMYERGDGVFQDYAEAIRLYRLAAEQGFAQAQTSLGLGYSEGRGVVQDYAEAIMLYRLAAEQGFAKAQNNLGAMYEYGRGVLQDNILSHMWYNIASANGYKKSSEWRDGVAAKMTAADVSKAQAMAKECMSSGYKNCGW
jgi:uncharacterized protein